MKMRGFVLSCALGAAACGGSDGPPANSPASVNATAGPYDTNSGSTPGSTSDSPSTATVSPTQASSTTAGTGRPRSDDSRSSKRTGNATENAPQVAADPVVAANNPGVADQTKDADNTKINERDRHGGLTPMDQGGSAAERNITATIRKGVVGDKTLSFTAKNVKIITTGTKVTLRGPVNSDQEKAAIEALARQTAGVTDVDNQLEVKK